jgi:hypothetical protein
LRKWQGLQDFELAELGQEQQVMHQIPLWASPGLPGFPSIQEGARWIFPAGDRNANGIQIPSEHQIDNRRTNTGFVHDEMNIISSQHITVHNIFDPFDNYGIVHMAHSFQGHDSVKIVVLKPLKNRKGREILALAEVNTYKNILRQVGLRPSF